MYDSKKTLFVGFPFENEVGPKEAKETQGRIVKAFEEQTNTKYNVVDYVDAAGMVDHPILGLAKKENATPWSKFYGALPEIDASAWNREISEMRTIDEEMWK